MKQNQVIQIFVWIERLHVEIFLVLGVGPENVIFSPEWYGQFNYVKRRNFEVETEKTVQ
jgi:hypothetical protein